MTQYRKGKELIIEGEAYVDTQAVHELLNGLISDNSIRELGKEWGRQKVGNRYFYRKADVKLPDYPVARWQQMALMYLSLMRPEFPVMQFSKGNYYHAQAFLRGAQVEMLATGNINGKTGNVIFLLLAITAKVYRLHLVVMDGATVAGRQLNKEEVDAIQTARVVNGFDARIWNLQLLAKVADELLAPVDREAG